MMTPAEITARVMDYLAKLIPDGRRSDVHFVMFVSDTSTGENSMICSMGSVDAGMSFAKAHIDSLGRQPGWWPHEEAPMHSLAEFEGTPPGGWDASVPGVPQAAGDQSQKKLGIEGEGLVSVGTEYCLSLSCGKCQACLDWLGNLP